MAAENYERIMDHIFRFEGGYVDHAKDPGGATNMGITIGTLSDHLGRPATKAEVRGLSKDVAREIYRKRYWNAVSGDELAPGVDLCVMDSAVNSGPSRGVKWLQRAVGAEVDGEIGTKTLAAADAASASVTVERMCDDRMNFLKGLSTWSTFGTGWSRRVDAVRSLARTMAREEPMAAPPEPTPPIAQTPSAGPTSKATGGAVGAAIPNAILLLLVKLHVIPADVASDPETILLLTTLLTAAGAWFGAFVAPRNGAQAA